MSEDIYAKPDLTKKVRFKAGEKDDRNMDVCDDIDSVRIYDNCWAEESTPRDKSEDKSEEKSEDKSWDNTTEDQQQMSSVSVSSGKRNRLGAAAVFLGLLCLLLLVAVVVLVFLLIPERNQLSVDNVNLTRERDELQTSYSEMRSLNHNLTTERKEMESLNHNLTNERKELQTSYSKMESLNAKLTSQLDNFNIIVNDLKNMRDELQKQIETTCCADSWIKFGKSCYFMSRTVKNWHNSKRECENRDAHLVIISSEEEQKFISSFNRRVWIGLTDGETENTWKWVDGTTPDTTYWRGGQPNNGGTRGNEDCAEISGGNWNDLSCSQNLYFICEIMFE